MFTRIFSGVGGVATRAFTGVAGTITGILGRAGAAVAAGPLGKIGSVVAKGFGKLSTLFGPLQKLGGAILGPFGGILGKVLPVVGVITLIISAVQILRDNLDKVREVIRNVFGDAGVEVFDKIVTAISNIGSTIQSIFTDGNLGGARDFLINLFGEEATGVIDGAITVLQTVWNILSGFIEFVNTYVRPIVEQIFYIHRSNGASADRAGVRGLGTDDRFHPARAGNRRFDDRNGHYVRDSVSYADDSKYYQRCADDHSRGCVRRADGD